MEVEVIMSISIPTIPIATSSRLRRIDTKLLVIDQNYTYSHHKLYEFPDLLTNNDIVVINNTATLPASLFGYHAETGEKIELRLVSSLSTDPSDLSYWTALLFGDGDWTLTTEERKNVSQVDVGTLLYLGDDLTACVEKIFTTSKRYIKIRFLGPKHDLWQKIYRYGKPIQYSYLTETLHLWDVQTAFSGPPVSVEAPSASFQLSWDLLLRLKQKKIQIVPITHAISISSTGDTRLDQELPFPERYWLSQHAADVINHAKAKHKRIIAVGTSVTRALEANASKNDGIIMAGTDIATLKIDANYKLKIVTNLLTGMHVPGASHIDLLSSFIPLPVLEEAYTDAISKNYLWHEFGDLMFV